MSEQINHPLHYNQTGRSECIIELEEKYGTKAVIDFCMCNAHKYEYRAGYKDNAKQDMAKAEWYKNYAAKLKSRSISKQKNYNDAYIEKTKAIKACKKYREINNELISDNKKLQADYSAVCQTLQERFMITQHLQEKIKQQELKITRLATIIDERGLIKNKENNK